MTTVSWQLKLGVDGVGEVRAATGALREATKAASEVDKATKAAGGVTRDAAGRLRGSGGRFLSAGEKSAMGIPGIPSEFLAQPAKLGGFAKMLQAVSGGVSKVFGARAGAAASRGMFGLAQGLAKIEPFLPAIGTVVAGAGVVFAGAAALAAAGVRAVVGAQAFKEDSMGALKTLLRSNQLADQAFKTAVKTADFLGRGRQETVGQFVDLLAKGFDIKKVDEIVKAMADLATVDPKANMDAIVRAIGQIKGTGRLQGDELLQLADAGLETSAVYEQLAKILKKSVPDVQKQISAGKVDADVAIQAILAAINAQAGGGAAGAAANKKSLESITGLLRRLENLPQNLLFSMDVGPGMERVREFLKELNGFFDMNSESGREMTDVLSEAFNQFMSGLLGKDITKDTKEGLQSIVDTIRELNEAGKLQQFGKVVADFAKMAAMAATVVSWMSRLTHVGDTTGDTYFALANDLAEVYVDLRDSIGGAVTDIETFFSEGVESALEFLRSLSISGSLLGLPAQALQFLSDLGTTIWDGLTGLVTSIGEGAVGIGTGIIDGLVSGLLGGAARVIGAISGIAQGAVDAAKGILQQRSPSKVFAEIGHFTTEGFAQGVADNDNAQRAMANMVAPPGAGATGALRIGGGRGGPLIGSLTIQVNGRGQDDEKLARLIAAEVQRTLENLAIQIGAVSPDPVAA